MLRSTLMLGVLGLLSSACIVGNGPEGTTDQEIKGRNKVFASQRATLNHVAAFDQDGSHQYNLKGAGVATPFGVHVEVDDIFVVSQANNAVYAHIHSEGENESEHHTLNLLVPSGGGGLVTPFYPAFHGGLLYVSSGGNHKIAVFDAFSGHHIEDIVVGSAEDPHQPRGMDFDSAGNLYFASFLKNTIYKRDTSGAITVFASYRAPCGVSIQAGTGRLCVGSAPPAPGVGDGVACYEPDGTKYYQGTAATVCGLDWGPGGRVYSSNPPKGLLEVHDFSGAVATFASVPAIAGVSWGVTD